MSNTLSVPNLIAPTQAAPGSSTPNLGLQLEGLITNEANNASKLDTVLGNAVLLAPQGKLQVIDINAPQSVSAIAPVAPTLYAVSIYVASYGDGAPSTELVTTITWTDPSGTLHTITLDLAGNVAGIQVETYPLLVGAGKTITVAETFSSTPFHYDASVRIVQLP
jgi:hypothetical protein